MNKSFTELPLPLKERMIIRVYVTKVLDPDRCDSCHMKRVPAPGEKSVPPMCDVCGRMLCRGCYGDDGTVPGPGLKHYHICDACVELESEEINTILELRAKLGGMR